MRFNILAVLGVILLTGCMSVPPLSYKSVGSINNEPAAIEITRAAPIKGTAATISINDEVILVTERRTRITANPNCQRLSLYAYSCTDEGTYNGKEVRVVEDWSANMQAGYAHFDVYVNNQLIQRVEAVGGY